MSICGIVSARMGCSCTNCAFLKKNPIFVFKDHRRRLEIWFDGENG
jgi:hypothetical protein